MRSFLSLSCTTFVLFTSAGFLAGCADDTMMTTDTGTGIDGGDDGGVDTGIEDDGGLDSGVPTDTGVPLGDGGVCPRGYHMCSTGCERDRANEPSEGCRNGCGLECPGEGAVCTPGGECSVMCEPPAMLFGAVCCGGMPICSGPIAAECPRPDEESNDDMENAVDLGNMDDNDTRASIDKLTLLEGDEDWFVFTVTDSITVTARTEIYVDVNIETSMENTMEAAMWFTCADEDTVETSHECRMSTVNPEFGDGCSTPIGTDTTFGMDLDCEGTILNPVGDESGTMYLRIQRTASATVCDEYTVNFHVHEELPL